MVMKNAIECMVNQTNSTLFIPIKPCKFGVITLKCKCEFILRPPIIEVHAWDA